MALKQLENLPKNRPPIREFYFVRDREKVLSELEKNGFVMNDTWYDIPVSPARYYKKAKFPEKECPVALEAAEQIINLPNHYAKNELKKAREIIAKYELKEKN
jgi:dTDP-4-amino-4,6-dideoxygalactose transaminase